MARRKKSKRRPRSISSFSRRPGKRQPRKYVLIVCGGTETEPNYFCSLRHELRLGSVVVQVEGIGRDPGNVVSRAIKTARTDGFDEIWCVLDVENPHENPSFYPAMCRARKHKLELAVSNPAFEYWYLLHFKETDRPFGSASQAIEALKEFIPDYEKSSDVFAILFEHTDIAIKRAERILANHPDADQDFPNPSTLVFKLIKSLKDMSN